MTAMMLSEIRLVGLRSFDDPYLVHHLTPLSEIEEEYEVDPINDLRPVCPNCHAIIHLKPRQPFTLKEVKTFIKKREGPS